MAIAISLGLVCFTILLRKAEEKNYSWWETKRSYMEGWMTEREDYLNLESSEGSRWGDRTVGRGGGGWGRRVVERHFMRDELRVNGITTICPWRVDDYPREDTWLIEGRWELSSSSARDTESWSPSLPRIWAQVFLSKYSLHFNFL